MSVEATKYKIEVMQAYLDGAEIEMTSAQYPGNWIDVSEIEWNWVHVEYRVKQTQDSIDWSHVHKDFKWMARDKEGTPRLYLSKPKITDTYWASIQRQVDAQLFASYKRGTVDWKQSLVERPDDE